MKNTFLSLFAIFVLLSLSSCRQRVELDGSHRSISDGVVSIAFGADLSDYNGLTMRGADSRVLTTDFAKDIGRFSIDGIRIVLYNQNEQGDPTTVAYVFEKDAKIYKGKISGDDAIVMDRNAMSIQIKGSEEITIGDYTVLFFTSPSESLKTATTVGKGYSELMNAMTYDYKSPTQGMKNLGFNLYSNVEHPLKVTAQELSHHSSSTTPYLLNATQLSLVNALLYINYPATLSLPGFKLNVARRAHLYIDAQNKKFTLFPKYEESQFDNPLDGKADFRIPKDPNYEGFASKSIEELQNEFEYLDKTWGTTYSFYNEDKKENNVVMPVAENTLKSSEANGAVTTRLILGIPLVPDEITLSNNQKSFFIYEGKTMSVEAMKMAYMNALSSSSPDVNQSRLIAEIKKFNDFARKTGAETGAEQLLLPKRSGYESSALKYYNDGLVYYLLPSRHFSDVNVSDRDKPGRFGIVRNTLYLYNIISLSKIGAANPLVFTENREYNYNNQMNLSFNIALGSIDVIESDVNL